MDNTYLLFGLIILILLIDFIIKKIKDRKQEKKTFPGPWPLSESLLRQTRGRILSAMAPRDI